MTTGMTTDVRTGGGTNPDEAAEVKSANSFLLGFFGLCCLGFFFFLLFFGCQDEEEDRKEERWREKKV